jgi:hypothetical protein
MNAKCRMPNAEMPNAEMPNAEMPEANGERSAFGIGHSAFGIRHSFLCYLPAVCAQG